MIRNENEYREAVARLKDERARLNEQKQNLKETGLTDEEIKRAIDPLESFHQQLQEEVDSYNKLCQGSFTEVHNFRGIGQLLIGLRIAHGLTQRQLADLLKVHESQVSRDERNEYFNITFERANRILDVLNAELITKVENPGLETAS